MKALLVNPETQTIEETQIADYDEIVKLIGFDTVISDEIGPQGDRLFFDEECFLRGTSGRFQIDKVIPVSGVGIIIGSSDDGDKLRDVVSDIDGINERIKYL